MSKTAMLMIVGLLMGCSTKIVDKPEHVKSILAIEGDRDLIPVKTVPPRYPTSAVKDRIEGGVCFLLTIQRDGSVSDLRVLKSAPEGVFDVEASRALSKWTFKPFVIDGVQADVPDKKYCLDFRLS